MSIINVNQIQPVGSGQTITINATNLLLSSGEQLVTTNRTQTLSNKTVQGGTVTLGTAVNLPTDGSAGSNIDFTGIPSWAKRITVMMNGTSLNALTPFLIQLGTSAGVTNSGYTSYWGYAYGPGTGTAASTAGFGIHCGAAAEIIWTNMIISNVTGNTWLASHSGALVTGPGGTGVQITGGGNVTLSGTLDRVRITSVNGTALYDLGSVNIMYEG